MADDITTETPEVPEVETPDAVAEEKVKPSGDVPPEVKAALRKANKEAETLRLRLQEFEDRDKTEAQKLTDRAEAAERRADEIESRALRLEVAAEKGLSPAQAKRLVGATREDLEADADELLETFKPADQPSPSVDFDLGTRPDALRSTDPKSADLAQIEADLKAAKRR